MRDCPEEASWPLTELGHEQAKRTGDFIRQHIGTAFDRGYVSPFCRARETAIGLALDVDWKVDDRLRERLWGDYPTQSYSPEQYIADLHHCAEPTWKAPFPNAESIGDLEPETSSFLIDLPLGKDIVAVTHGGTIGAIQRVLERNPPHRALGNCGVLEYEIESAEKGWRGRARFACPVFGDDKFGDWLDFG